MKPMVGFFVGTVRFLTQACAGAFIVAILKRTGQTPCVVLERQFRPSVGTDVIQLPAGLADRHESASAAAVRELYEETGYTGVVVREVEQHSIRTQRTRSAKLCLSRCVPSLL